MLAPFRGKPPLQEAELTSVQAAVSTTKAVLPGMTVRSIAFPGSPFSTPYHYLLWTNGNTPLTARLFSPVLVDARTGELTATVPMPWYLRLLEISRPLHFGGMPLKTIWVLLDLVTIGVLGSGLYLWPPRCRAPLGSALADAATGIGAAQPGVAEPASVQRRRVVFVLVIIRIAALMAQPPTFSKSAGGTSWPLSVSGRVSLRLLTLCCC